AERGHVNIEHASRAAGSYAFTRQRRRGTQCSSKRGVFCDIFLLTCWRLHNKTYEGEKLVGGIAVRSKKPKIPCANLLCNQ
ncbi:MAG: hypothetical protein ACK55Z_23410, partial [bacterium]